MRLAVILLTFVLATTLGNGAAEAFDCTGVTLPSSIVICSDPDLTRLADERQQAIDEARGRIGEEARPVPVGKPTDLGPVLRPGLRHSSRSASADASSGVYPRLLQTRRGIANCLHPGAMDFPPLAPRRP
jgi:hypothetical protein